MNQEFTYREGSKSDFNALKELGKLAYSQFEKVLQPQHWQSMRDYLDNEQKLSELIEKARCLVCLDAEKLVGMAYLVPHGNPTVIFPPDWSYIRMVGVHPDYRGQGISRKLTARCIEYAKQSGEKIIGLHTSEIMPDAQQIYHSFGFKIEKELELLYGVKYWLYKLQL